MTKTDVLVIVPCGQRKVWDTDPGRGPTPARDVYTGSPFKVNRQYAERFGECWVILSAKYGFIPPEFLVPGPYNVTFKDPRTSPIQLNALKRQVQELSLGNYRTIIGLGGNEYRVMIEDAFSNTRARIVFPFAGLPIGKLMAATKQAIEAGRPFDTLVPQTSAL